MYKIVNHYTDKSLWLWYSHFLKNCIILRIFPISIFQRTCLFFYLHWNYSFTINSKHPKTSYLVQHSRNGLPNYLQLELDSCLAIVYNKYTFGNTQILNFPLLPILSQLIDLQTKQDLKQVCLLFLHQSAETDLKALCNQTFLIQTSTLYFRAGKLITDIQTDILLTLRIRKRKAVGGGRGEFGWTAIPVANIETVCVHVCTLGAGVYSVCMCVLSFVQV